MKPDISPNSDNKTEGHSLPPIRLIYITSQGHSGSTLLDLLIAGHSQVFSIGEIKKLPEVYQSGPCTCGEPTIEQCPFWQQVNQYLIDRNQTPLAEMDVNADDPQTFQQHNYTLLTAVKAISNQPVILDSSKSLPRLKKLLACDLFDVTPIFLRRHPAGVVQSNVRKGRSWWHYTKKYRKDTRKRIKALRDIDHINLQYEALASDPRSQMEQLMQSLGIPFEAQQMNLNQGVHHNVNGNRMRFQDNITIRLDEKWKKQLPFYQQCIIKLINIRWLPNHHK